MTERVHDPEGHAEPGHPQPPEPVVELLAAARRTSGPWLRRVTEAAASRGGVTIPADELAAAVDTAIDELLGALAALLALDVDEQGQNPLSLFRAATLGPTRLLLAAGARSPQVDGFAAAHFPDDPFGLGPANWTDIDPAMHEPGITWGAWKAMTVLRRRREEGRR